MSINSFHEEFRNIEQKQHSLWSTHNPNNLEKELIDHVNQWKSRSIAIIENRAKKTIENIQTMFREPNSRFSKKMNEISTGLAKPPSDRTSDLKKINQLLGLLSECEAECRHLSSMKIIQQNHEVIPLITISGSQPIDSSRVMGDQRRSHESRNANVNASVDSRMALRSRWTEKQSDFSEQLLSPRQSSSYGTQACIFGSNTQSNPSLKSLLERLCILPEMNKYGPMSGACDEQTTQMENFLKREFGFENIPGESIVHGVQNFRLRYPPDKQDPTRIIHFPRQETGAFSMTMEEILKWQRSYRVYAPKTKSGITKFFLEKALQGGSDNGPEAFLMKFVVRISTCPILMEFDARVKSRKLDEDWPHRIKLVSVTGVDFACRIHDMDDVKTYIQNWRDLFRIDPHTKQFEIQGGRDILLRNPPQVTKLDETKLHNDLMTMAKIRLQACDQEGVQIVVETGIGLGIFSGVILGIDSTVRKLSAMAIRRILEEDGPRFQHIKAVIFALPIFPSRSDPDGSRTSVFKTFKDEFTNPPYRGSIPVLVVDQDMHRLAVAIAKEGYQVSELNPADSHGVFGEYWQNRGPAVEEKLALTTLGLLVQHHLMNKLVLDSKTYQLI